MSEENKKSKRFILINSTIINTEKVVGFRTEEMGGIFRVLACFNHSDFIIVGEFDNQAEAMDLIDEISDLLYKH